jgi:hypothetical protein
VPVELAREERGRERGEDESRRGTPEQRHDDRREREPAEQEEDGDGVAGAEQRQAAQRAGEEDRDRGDG